MRIRASEKRVERYVVFDSVLERKRGYWFTVLLASVRGLEMVTGRPAAWPKLFVHDESSRYEAVSAVSGKRLRDWEVRACNVSQTSGNLNVRSWVRVN